MKALFFDLDFIFSSVNILSLPRLKRVISAFSPSAINGKFNPKIVAEFMENSSASFCAES
jgi:hypothetical protein